MSSKPSAASVVTLREFSSVAADYVSGNVPSSALNRDLSFSAPAPSN